MPKDYWHCPTCNGNFDHGEPCDCKEKNYSNMQQEEPKLIVSETLILGVDISGGKDISCIQVVKQFGNTREIINTVYGEEAEKTYDILMNRGWSY